MLGAYSFSLAGVAQLVEQLTCNQQVVGSTPIASSILLPPLILSAMMSRVFDSISQGFQSGQMDQTVNLTRKLRWFESTPLHHI